MSAKRLLSGVLRPLAPATLAMAVLALPAGGAGAAVGGDGTKAGAAAAARRCPDPHGTGRQARFVRVTGVSCATARAMIRKVVVKAPTGCLERIDAERTRLSSPCRIGGYRCTSRGISDHRVIDATCRRGAKLVRFQY